MTSTELRHTTRRPVKHCRVKRAGSATIGLVLESTDTLSDNEVSVRWFGPDEIESVTVSELLPAFEPGSRVKECPPSGTHRQSLGRGSLLSLRPLGGAIQACVQLDGTCEIRLLPWQNLAISHDPADRFALQDEPARSGDAERVRLRILAELLRDAHMNAGLALPRQHGSPTYSQKTVQKLLESAHANRLLTDRFGIDWAPELLDFLIARQARGDARRVLILASNTSAVIWQQRLNINQDSIPFLIWNKDDPEPLVADNDAPYLIVTHESGQIFELLDGESWEVIIVDDAHRLPLENSSSELEMLRHSTPSLLLITFAPHSGRRDKLRKLLQLVNPFALNLLSEILAEPDRIKTLILTDPTCARQAGQVANPLLSTEYIDEAIVHTCAEIQFHEALQNWLQEIEDAGYHTRGIRRHQIRFFSAFCRKFAASSNAAILEILVHRMNLLEPASTEFSPPDEHLLTDAASYRVTAALREASAYFPGEAGRIHTLLTLAKSLPDPDSKLCRLIDLIDSHEEAGGGGAIVIATTSLTTQNYVYNALLRHYPGSRVATNTESNLGIQCAGTDQLANDNPFLLVTVDSKPPLVLPPEFQTLINFDLPRKLSTLTERLRCVNSGARKHSTRLHTFFVTTFPDDVDITIAWKGLRQHAVKLATIQGGDGDYHHSVWAAHLANTDVRFSDDDVVNEWATLSRHQSDIVESHDQAKLTREHIESFFLGVCNETGASVHGLVERPGVYRVFLAKAARELIGIERTFTTIAFDEAIAEKHDDAILVDWNLDLYRALINLASSEAFGGHYAKVADRQGISLVAARLSWTDETGQHLYQRVKALVEKSADIWSDDPADLNDWLLKVAEDGEPDTRNTADSFAAMEQARNTFEQMLANTSHQDQVPASLEILAAACSSPV